MVLNLFLAIDDLKNLIKIMMDTFKTVGGMFMNPLNVYSTQ